MNRVLLHLFLIFISTSAMSQPRPITILQNNPDISLFKFTPDGKYLIASGHRLNYWDVENWEIHKTYEIPPLLAISIDCKLGVYDKGDVSVNLHNLENDEFISNFNGHTKILGSGHGQFLASILYGSISHDNKKLVTVSNDQTAILWDIDSKEMIHQFTTFVPGTFDRTGFEISTTTFSPNNDLIAFGHSFFSLDNFELLFELDLSTIKNRIFPSIKFSTSGKYLYSSELDGRLQIWNWDQKILIYYELIHDALGFNSDITNDDIYLISVGRNRLVKLIDIENKTSINSFEFYDSILEISPLISIHPESKYFAISSNNGQVLIYDLQEVLASQSGVADWEAYE